MQINPKQIIQRGILIPAKETEVAQNGIDCTVAETVLIKAKGFANVELQERVNIPSGVFATTNVRSSFSRKGIFTTTGVWDSGYNNGCGCSLYNLGDEDVIIASGTRVLQFIFWEGNESSMYDGHYNNNDGIDSQFDKQQEEK